MRAESESTTPEQAFAHYCRDGDPQALAVAFDATAPELLRVAAFLVPSGDVEDLLHDTFGVAIARRQSYDAARPLLPWLLGLLANEARTARRRARMRRREIAARAPAAERDPAAVAADRETAAAFEQALRQLGSGEAALLRQHLVDDLSCREIAERMRRPAGTVRTQVARAMSELRRRLPVGLAVAPGFGIGDSRMLANVRARVLAGAPAVTAGLARPHVRWWLPSACVLAVLVVVMQWSRTDQAPPPSPATVTADLQQPRPERPERPDAIAATGATPTTAAQRTEVAPPVSGWWLRGHVRTDAGDAIPGALVRLHLRERGPMLAESSTDSEGRYELDLAWWRDRPPLDRRGHALVAIAEAAGHHNYTHLAELPDAPPGEAVQLVHDYTLSEYVTIAGRCVDAEGRPVAADVHAVDTDTGNLHGAVDADAKGRFRIALAEPPARLRLDARHARAGRVRLDVAVPEHGEVDLGDVGLAPGHRIQGRVVLADGTPFTDCELALRGRVDTEHGLPRVGPDFWYCDVRTDQEGRFVANRTTLERWSVRVLGCLGLGEAQGVREIHVPESSDTVDVVLDGVRVDFRWQDVEGRELLPPATRVVVFAPSDRDEAIAARGGDLVALRRALADEVVNEPHVVVPCGAHLWLQARGGTGHGIDRMLQVPAQNGRVAVDLQFEAVASTELTIRVRFVDGGVPATFDCVVTPRAGASLHGFEELQRGPGFVRGRCAVGPITLDVRAYPERFDEVIEGRAMVAVADRDNEIEVVLSRRGRIRFELRDVTASMHEGDGPRGEVTIGGVRARRFCFGGDEMQYWSSPPLDQPVETMSMVPIGRHEVRFEIEGYEPTTVWFDVVEGEPEKVLVWLRPR